MEMETRIAVIGLGWFGEIHCDAISAIPSFELAALCTRTEIPLEDLGASTACRQAVHRLQRALLNGPRHRRGQRRHHVGPAHRTRRWPRWKPASTCSSKNRWRTRWPIAAQICDAAKKPRAPDDRAYLPVQSALCDRQAGDRGGAIGKVLSLSSSRNIPAAWTPEILNKIGPIVGDAIHDTDLMLWFTGARVVSAYAQTVDLRGKKYPDIGQTMYRFDNGATATLETVWCMPEKTPFDIDERMSVIGSDGFIHVQDTFPNIGIVTKDGFRSPDTTYWPQSTA